MGKCCPEDRDHWISGDWCQVYRLGENKFGLHLPGRGDGCNEPRDSYLCGGHLRQIPAEELKDTPDGIDGVVYGISPRGGNVVILERLSDTVAIARCSEEDVTKYVSERTLKQHLPGAAYIIGRQVRDVWYRSHKNPFIPGVTHVEIDEKDEPRFVAHIYKDGRVPTEKLDGVAQYRGRFKVLTVAKANALFNLRPTLKRPVKRGN